MRTLRPHIVVLDKRYPSREMFEHLVDKKTDTAHGHWYWDGDFHDDGFERTPLFVWRALPLDRRVGKYIVARLLWVEANPGMYSRLVLTNTCGVFACVNPAHWENPNRERWWTLPDGATASLVHHAGIRYARIHARSEGSAFAVCGMSLRDGSSYDIPAESRAAITCVECVSMWLGLGRPLLEVAKPAELLISVEEVP